MSSIAENLERIKSEIGNAELVAVSKKQEVQKIREALEAGHRVFGENRAQEAAEKFPDLRKEFDDIELHLIGPLQTNKVRDALGLFDVIQSLDREKLARKIADVRSQMLDVRCKEFYVQVNIGEEEQKAGIAPKEADEFVKFCTQDLGLNVTGLMCIPPIGEPAFMYFALLRNIGVKCRSSATKALLAQCSPSFVDKSTQSIRSSKPKSESGGEPVLNLSMGMSADYMEAVELGATHVRIGTGVFGQREY